MAIGVYFRPSSLTTDQYDRIMEELDDAGATRPAGRVSHCCFGPAENLMVFDIWETQEAFETFGKILEPIAEKIGVDIGAPDVLEIHRVTY
jgi:hypothetical protein